jgi:acyl carrier protein
MLKEELLEYVSERAKVARAAVDAETPLFSDGLLDSMAILELTELVERRAQVRFAAPDITLENLDSIGRILTFVARQGG